MIPQATVFYHQRRTSEKLRLDIDGYRFEWSKLMSILNARYLAEQCNASFRIKTKGRGYHVAVGIPSNHELRRMLNDDYKRIRSSEIRAESGMPNNTDTIFDYKTDFSIQRGKVRKKRSIPYEVCSLDTVLALPFCSLGPMDLA
jgi:hypothetical protein